MKLLYDYKFSTCIQEDYKKSTEDVVIPTVCFLLHVGYLSNTDETFLTSLSVDGFTFHATHFTFALHNVKENSVT